MRQAGLFGLSDHLKRISSDGDPLEVDYRHHRHRWEHTCAGEMGARASGRLLLQRQNIR